MPEKAVSRVNFPLFKFGEAEQFSFYRVPKALFRYDAFSGVSTDAKLLYGLFLDRLDLSVKNKWSDDEGNAYIIFTIEAVQEHLNCGNKKAVRLMKELEETGLISRKKQFNRQPDMIYVHKFVPLSTGMSKGQAAECQNDTSRGVEMTCQGVSKRHPNHTEDNYTEYSYINRIPSCGFDGMDASAEYEAFFREQIAYDRLLSEYPYDQERLDEILYLLVDVCMSGAKTIRISGEDKPAAVVKSQLMKLNQFHIGYVMKCMSENGTKIRNIRQYLLAALYNAPFTMGHYFQAWVNHDMVKGNMQGGGDNT